MVYENMIDGIFVSRPNRFLANVRIPADTVGKDAAREWNEVACHVKNTGRCRELLVPGCRVLVQFHPDAADNGRKTAYSLIGVYKETADGTILVNMDSQAPNQVAAEWLREMESDGTCAFSDGKVRHVRREVVYGNSRFDLAFELDYGNNGERACDGGNENCVGIRQAFMEVKGVTLEVDGTAMFPDAPTERGIKHVKELAAAVAEGYEAFILLVVQMKGVQEFVPNWKTHEAFGDALVEAQGAGVRILSYDCQVTKNSLRIDQPLPVRLSKGV